MLKKIVVKKIDGSKLKIVVIRAKFNEKITANLLSGCLKALQKQQVKKNSIKVLEVPGAFELPIVAKKLTSKADVVICLGAVIRGGTPHFEYISGESARGIMAVSLQIGKPVINGIITCDNLRQAVVRSSNNLENKGWQAGIAAVEMGILFKNF